MTDYEKGDGDRWPGPVCGKFDDAAKTQFGVWAVGPIKSRVRIRVEDATLDPQKWSLGQARVRVKQVSTKSSLFFKKKILSIFYLFIIHSYFIIFLSDITICTIC